MVPEVGKGDGTKRDLLIVIAVAVFIFLALGLTGDNADEADDEELLAQILT